MLTSIDLFAGCGGLSEGFEKAGSHKSLGFVEWELQPCRTLINRLETKWNYNNAKDIVLRFDIQRTDELINGWQKDIEFGSHVGLKQICNGKEVDIIVGGPPCQAYSIAGRVRDEKGMHEDYRNFLFESYMKVVDYFQPKLFVFENVEGILSAQPGGISIIKRINESFTRSGYSTIQNIRKYALLNAADYGVPQNRKRVIIIGVNNSLINTDPEFALQDFYTNILPYFKPKKKTTVREAIGDLPKLKPLKEQGKYLGKKMSHSICEEEIFNHFPRFHSERDQEIFRELALDKLNGSAKYASVESLIKLYFEKTGNETNFHKYYVLDLNKQSNTIPAHLYKDGLRHIHPDPEQARSITVREAARLQGFDNDFEFLGSVGDQYKMIGNAVPPILSEKIAKAVSLFIEKYF
jgi:DNA (cytosine-5)-methyltransferase 1